MPAPSVKTNEARALALTAQLQIEAAESADGKPASLPRFRMVAYTGGPMRVSGWRYPVVVDLAGMAVPSQARPIRFGHDASSGVGHTDTIRVEAGQLIAAGVVSRDTPAAREIVASGRNGFPWQASIGASVEEFEFVKAGQKVLANGRSFEGPLNVVRKSTLGEISFVDLGADGNTSALVQANQQEDQLVEGTSPTVTASDSAVAPTPAPAPAAVAVAAPPVIAAAPAPAPADRAGLDRGLRNHTRGPARRRGRDLRRGDLQLPMRFELQCSPCRRIGRNRAADVRRSREPSAAPRTALRPGFASDTAFV